MALRLIQLPADIILMEPATREPRTRVMIAVEAWWQDKNGSVRAVAARMENRSESGACIRIGVPVAVGARLGIRGRWDQFTGTARYCIPNEGAFLVGIEKDGKDSVVVGQIISTAAPVRAETKSSGPAVSAVATQTARRSQEGAQGGSFSSEPLALKPYPRPVMQAAAGENAPVPPRASRERIESKSSIQERKAESPRRTEPQPAPASKESGQEETGKKRKLMRRNWFGMSNRETKQDAPLGNEASNGNNNGNRPHETAPAAPKSFAEPANNGSPAGFPVELLAIEDVYRTSGIRTPRKDYGINKVMEMLRSEHVRGLSNEMKRAAILMALDAAGIPVDEVVRDAKVRHEALDSYEAERKKQIEAEWERKAKENAQILAELEAAKLQHMAAINRNLDRIAREKTTFNEWRALKQQESQSIADAVALCLKASAAQSAPDSPPVRASLDASSAEPAPVSSVAAPAAEKALR